MTRRVYYTRIRSEERGEEIFEEGVAELVMVDRDDRTNWTLFWFPTPEGDPGWPSAAVTGEKRGAPWSQAAQDAKRLERDTPNAHGDIEARIARDLVQPWDCIVALFEADGRWGGSAPEFFWDELPPETFEVPAARLR